MPPAVKRLPVVDEWHKSSIPDHVPAMIVACAARPQQAVAPSTSETRD
jgi:hypothetical protein